MYDKKILQVFLENQLQLFPEKVAEDEQEAAEFLEDVCATVCKNKKKFWNILRMQWISQECQKKKFFLQKRFLPLATVDILL
ncbi:hypothetical protein CIY_31270 [Butyrivibrio fibrisolvens 16/4]|nr:hypothetical protein CIY_31270 [Butyrivibrio fibrisolvens 16/4]